MTFGRARRGYALAFAVALMFMLTVLLGVAVNHVDYSSGVTEVYLNRFQARSALISMTNAALKWLSSEVAAGSRPRSQVIINGEDLTDFNSLRIFISLDLEGCEVGVYDLEYDTRMITGDEKLSATFPPSFSGGYMVRGVVEKSGMAPLTLESVYAVTEVLTPGGSVVEVLDEKPIYWRELFRK